MMEELVGIDKEIDLDEQPNFSRIKELSPIEIAYLCKGLNNLSSLFEQENKLLESRVAR
jgi:hypothetical protein